MKLIGSFLLVMISNWVVGQNANHSKKFTVVTKISRIEITHVDIQVSELKTLEKRSQEEISTYLYGWRCGRPDCVSYYIDGTKYVNGIKVVDPEEVERNSVIVLDGKRDRTYSYLDIQRMPKEENLFNSLWLK